MSATPARGRALAAPARRRATAGAAAQAAWRRRRLVLLLDEPVDRRLHGLLRLPARDERVPLVHALRPALAAALGRARELPLPASRTTRRSGRRCKNTLWLIAVAVPLQVLFAFGVAMMLARARRGVGFFRTIFYLPALAPPVAATLGFVYILNPATGPGEHASSARSASRARSGSSRRSGRSRRSSCSALWGIGNTMIIFLAAVLDVPQHLYESAELDGAGPLQRLRWVTLPTISPVILFAVVIGVIQGLQYFTQAYVAASIASGQASQAGDDAVERPRLPGGLDALLSRAALPARASATSTWATRRRWRCCCSSSSFAVTLVIIRNSRRWVHYRRGGASERRRAVAAPLVRRRAAGRRAPAAASCSRSPNHSLLIARRDRVPRAVRLHRADVADDERPGALVASSGRTRSAGSNFVDVFTTGAALALDAEHDDLRGARDARRARLEHPGRLRARAAALARAATPSFMIVLVALMLPPQVTVVPLYVMWAKLHLVGTLWPLIIPNWFGDAFSIFLLRQFFLTIPEEYLDAARVDGCGELRILVTVVAAAREAGDRRRRAVLVPLHVQRLLPAAALHGREPAQLGAVDRARRSSARCTRCSGT